MPPVSAIPIAHDPRRPTSFYTLRHADGDQVVSLLRSLFIVVDPAHPYATFEFEEAQPIDSLIVTASAEHQAEVARVLALVDLHVQNVEACWTEVLRYRANTPYYDEIEAVRSGASWFKVNGRRLWS